MRQSKKQQGAVLIVALMFLLLTAMISATVMQTSIMETHMANNEQLREEAFQQVQAVANAISADSNNLVIAGDVGYTICSASLSSGCDAYQISLTSAVTTVPTGASLDYTVERLGPLFAPLPFRASEENAGSANAYKAALFEVNADYDGVAAGLGQAKIAQGIAMRVAVGAQ